VYTVAAAKAAEGVQVDEPIRCAHERLSSAFRSAGLSLAPVSGVIDGMTVHDQLGRYIFAWHKNPHHLLFYLRKPALDAKTTLRQKAIARHSDRCVRRNPEGETTITLNSETDAETLLDWLLPALPLPRML
jgi:hypothetical protein